MSIGSKLLLFALAATFVAAEGPGAHAAPRPPLCTAGRFAVSGAPLLGPGGEVVVLENRTLAHRDALSGASREAEAPEEGHGGRDRLPEGQRAAASAPRSG